MITLKTDIPFDIFDAIQEQAQKLPALVKRGLPRVTRPIDNRMLAELTFEPPVWTRKRRWNSLKQMRAFFATNGFGHGIPYKRTGNMVRQWKVKTIFTVDGGVIEASNDSPHVDFVQGDRAQMMHLDSGWHQAAPIYSKYLPVYEDAVIDFWFTIADPLAGIPKK